ncbi:Na+/H+ antiporter [Flavobacterium cyanobacteriorum]|uniref:Na+/H+ antiporter n=1 Tax=Flavobacterium cyanobacteriorum TaxID=2022802 RepID=A0A255YUW2_9FLAO|nr:Na+/H+ antiporter [Flavobacterium cyanobacteriorum]OYQ32998.1 Na+/H+ antiporter [Flavobacterium cyanobacteriorum]
MENITIIIMLLFGMSFLGLLSKRFNFPFPIVLVLCGVVVSVVPGLPVIALNPGIVFIIFLPPLLYYAAWNTSWHDFKTSLRPISLAAIGLVLFTTVSVAVAAHYLIDDMGWPLAFLLGAIVSPPDAVAATSITKGLGLHPRIITILEGESLVNDASGLVAYKYALTAVTAGNFIVWEAGFNFLVVASAGVAIGLALGYIMYLVHKKFVCDPVVETTLTFLTPFAAYLTAEHFHFSGVLAVVSTGLYLSFRAGQIFTHQSRIMASAVWDVVVYILNGLIFILLGLQLRGVMHGISQYPVSSLIWWGVAISFVVIIVRFIWVVPAAMIPRMLSKKIRANEPFDKRNLVVFGWAGMRGVVSMAAALALPLTLKDGSAFPGRNLIIYLTFCVILSTLVLLGLTLPWIIKKMKMEPYSIYAEEYQVRNQVVSQTIEYIEENLSLLHDDLLRNIKSKYEVKFNRLQKTELPANYFSNGQPLEVNIFNEFTQLQIDLISVERKKIDEMHRKGSANEEVLRKIERELDLEETRLMMDMYEG